MDGTTVARQVVVGDGRRLGYQEFGAPDGHPAFFFHGWIGSRLDFAPNDEIARRTGVRVIAVDRPGCGASDFQPRRRLLDWPDDVAALADALGIDRFAVFGHSFGGPYVAACAYRLADRLTGAAIVAGISPVGVRGATRGMPAAVRLVLWTGGRAPALTRPFAALMGAAARRPSVIRKGIAGTLTDDTAALLDTARFAGFDEHLGEMVRDGSKGAYWDARVFLGSWDFRCEDITAPVTLFYGGADRNVPLSMGEYYRDTIPGARAAFHEGDDHFLLYSRADEILASLRGDG